MIFFIIATIRNMHEDNPAVIKLNPMKINAFFNFILFSIFLCVKGKLILLFSAYITREMLSTL